MITVAVPNITLTFFLRDAFFKSLFIDFEKERERGRERRRERENPKQAPRCQRRAPCPAPSPKPRDQDLSRSQEWNAKQSEPPKHPSFHVLKSYWPVRCHMSILNRSQAKRNRILYASS